MENAGFNFVQGLRENGHRVSVFTGNAYIKSGMSDGIKVYTNSYLPNRFPITDEQIIGIYKKNKRKISADLTDIIHKEKPDLIISWDPLWGIIQYLDKDIFDGIKTATVFHVVSDKRVLGLANDFNYDYYFAVSNHLKSQVAKMVKHNISILPNSINFGLYDDYKKNKEKTIIINGRLSPEKGIEYGVKGCLKFLKNNPGYKLVLFSGDFPFGNKNIVKNKIEYILKSQGLLDRTKFLDGVKWSKIPKLLIGSSIVILPSLFESFGIAALETMAAGTLLIATDVGNIPSLVQDAAILAKPKSAKDIQDALDSISEKDIDYLKRMNKSRKIAKKYDRKQIAKEFIKQVK